GRWSRASISARGWLAGVRLGWRPLLGGIGGRPRWLRIGGRGRRGPAGRLGGGRIGGGRIGGGRLRGGRLRGGGLCRGSRRRGFRLGRLLHPFPFEDSAVEGIARLLRLPGGQLGALVLGRREMPGSLRAATTGEREEGQQGHPDAPGAPAEPAPRRGTARP